MLKRGVTGVEEPLFRLFSGGARDLVIGVLKKAKMSPFFNTLINLVTFLKHKYVSTLKISISTGISKISCSKDGKK